MENEATNGHPRYLSPEALERLALLKETGLKNLDFEVTEKPKKYTHSFADLFKIKDTEVKFIIPELLPSATLAVLIGEDGIGKTQLMIQLGLHIAYKHDSFLGLPVSATHGRVLMIATEDSRLKFIKAANIQAQAMWPGYDPEKMDFHFTEASDFDRFDELKAEVTSFCDATPPDFIIIDALSDAYALINGSINDNDDTRTIMGFFQKIINVYGCTVMFIHHVAKVRLKEMRKEGRTFLDKFDSQGAGAITQKPRTILALSHLPGSGNAEGGEHTNFLHVVKLNQMSRYYYENAIELRFSGSSLTHQPRGLVNIEAQQHVKNAEADTKRVELTKAYNAKNRLPQEIPEPEYRSLIITAFGAASDLHRNDLVSALCRVMDCGRNAVERTTPMSGYLPYAMSKGWVNKNAAGRFTLGDNLKLDDELPFG